MAYTSEMTLNYMGSPDVKAQNCYFSANQNAKRLHGARSCWGMYSPARHAVSHTMTKSKKPRNVQRKPKAKRAPKSQGVGDREIIAAIRRLEVAQSRPNQLSGLGLLARDAGNAVSGFFGGGKIFGSGAYKLQTNSLMQSIGGNQVPVMHSESESVRICHREYIGDISSTSAFTISEYPINPGLAATFPFLAAVSQNFQEYRFKGLIFEFKTTSATAVASTNTALGSIMLAAQYRADAPTFTNKKELLNEMWATDTVPSQSVILPIECAPMETPLGIQYIRSGTQTGDLKFYDLGRLFVASSGSQATSVAGELWASYDVELFKPQINEPGVSPFEIGSSHFRLTGVTNGLLLGTLQLPVVNELNITTTSTTLTIPYGTYLITYNVVGDATTMTSGSGFFVATGGAVLLDVYQAGTTSTNYSANTGATLVTAFVATCVVYNSSTTTSGLVTLTNWVLPANASGGDLFVTPYSSANL